MSAARRLLLALLLPALLLAQSAGLLHGIAHGPLAKASAVTPAAAPLAKLFAGHDDDGTCRLYDQLAHGDAASAAGVALPAVLPPAFFLLTLQGLALARWAALFDARGPPAFR